MSWTNFRSILFVLHLGPLRDFFFAKYTLPYYYYRSERDIANKQHSTGEDRAISSAQVALGIIKSLVALNHGPLLSASSTLIS